MSWADWLVYGTDWRLQAAGGGLVLLGIGAGLVRLVGLGNALKIMAPAAAVFAALAYGRRERQQGWADAAAAGERDARRSIDEARRARADAVRRDADPDRLRDDDGFRRKH